ncbi:MAG: murein L,D-transpeptidase family protein [Pyrinomonadaceae bacterium]
MRTRALTLMLLTCSALTACNARADAGREVRASALTSATAETRLSQTETRAETGVLPLVTEDEAINRRPLKLPLSQPKIVVEKGARRLTLYSGGERVRVFGVALGFEPSGDKMKQGDGRTPEGEFYVCMKNERSKFYLSLGLSYPNAEDAERGLRDRIITRAQHKQIVDAINRGAKPPWNTPLGGEIFIHGGGAASDWTWGCVALANEQVKELFDAVPLGTHVRIEP